MTDEMTDDELKNLEEQVLATLDGFATAVVQTRQMAVCERMLRESVRKHPEVHLYMMKMLMVAILDLDTYDDALTKCGIPEDLETDQKAKCLVQDFEALLRATEAADDAIEEARGLATKYRDEMLEVVCSKSDTPPESTDDEWRLPWESTGEPLMFRGYEIEFRGRYQAHFVDTGEHVSETWLDRPCGFCGRMNTEEGYDGCIGEIPGATNACCGHGRPDSAYVQFEDGSDIRGQEALDYARKHGSAEAMDNGS